MKIENLFRFIRHPKKIPNISSILFCYIPKNIISADELFHSLNQQLNLQVFGGNWDALMDTLCDFEDVKEKYIIIMHETTSMNNNILFYYLSCLMAAALTWKKYSNEHIVSPIFSENDKEKIIKILYSDKLQRRFKIICNDLHLNE